LKMDRGLRRIQTMPVNDELVPLSDAAKNVGIVEDQAIAFRTGLLVKKESRGETRKSATDDHAVIHLAGLLPILRGFVVLSITDGMRVLNDLLGIASGVLIVALSAIAGPCWACLWTGLCTEREMANTRCQHSG